MPVREMDAMDVMDVAQPRVEVACATRDIERGCRVLDS